MIRVSALTGAVLSKELRVLSRQRRLYSLRVFYVLAVVTALLLLWQELTADYSYGNRAAMSANMDRVGRGVTMIVMVVQYAAVQLTAVGVLAGALNAEVRRRTLYVLLATPMRAPQVVFGKLLAGLWLCLSLVALSVPLLMLMRVFGGVSIWPLVGGLAVTVSGAVLLGSVAMFWSGICRQSWASLLLTLVTWGVYEIGSMVVLLHSVGFWGAKEVIETAMHLMPTWSLYAMVAWMSMPGGSWSGPTMYLTFSWPVACGIHLGIAAGVLALTCLRVRALANPPVRASAGAGVSVPPVKPAHQADPAETSPSPADGTAPSPPKPAAPPTRADNYRRVTGPPVVWHEARRALFRTPLQRVLGVLAITGILAIPYGIAIDDHALVKASFHASMVVLYLAAAAVASAVLAGVAIATEREARTLDVLLASGVSSGQIILGKAVGVLRRLWPVAIPSGVHVALTWLGFLASPAWPGYLLVIAAGVLAVSIGCGLLISTFVRRPTTGAVLSVVLVGILWLFVLLFIPYYMESQYRYDWPREVGDQMVEFSPFYQAGLVTWTELHDAAARNLGLFRAYHYHVDEQIQYDWPTTSTGRAGTNYRVFGAAMLWMGVGLALGGWACKRITRRKVM